MQIIKKVPVEKKSEGFENIFFRYLPYWPLFVFLMLLSIGGAWTYIHFTTPRYSASARVLIIDERKGVEESKTIESINLLSPKKIIENETEVIRSKTLINEVVKNLGLYAPIFEEKSLKTLSAYTTSPVKIEADLSGLKEAKKIYFTYDNNTSQVIIDKARYPLNQWLATSIGKLRFLRNKYYKNEPVSGKLFFSLVNPKSVANSIVGSLEVSTASKQSSIIDLYLTDEVPERGEDILNELLTSYNAAMVQDKNILATNTQDFIQERLSSVEHDLDSIERKIQQFKSQSDAIDIGTQGKLFLQNVSNNDQKLGEINMQLAVLGQVEKYVYSKDKSSGIVPSTLGVNDPTLSTLVDKLYSSELEYEAIKKTTGENNPMITSVTDKIEKIKPSILENIQSQRNSLRASLGNLNATNNVYSSVLRGMPEKERQLIEINREQSIKNEIYAFLLKKREETALSHVSTVPDSRIVDKAEFSINPVSPKKKVIYLSSVLLALFVGFASIFGREALSRKIMFRDEIETLTELPIIGEIAAESSKNPIVIGDNKRTFIAEQFRKLRITLNYIGVDSTHKKILITSAISGEGKSFIATNLALSLAITGKKVVLLDFDLNNPSLNNKLNIGHYEGITDYLLEKVEPASIIRKTDLHTNLFLIPTGELPTNPSELIMNGKVAELFNYLEAEFDYIVVDTAPVSPVTDAYILSPFCDATLFVIRHSFTPKIFVQRIDANNRINQLNNPAIVFNGIIPRGFGSKNYGYGYGYGYTYGGKEIRKRLPVSRK